MTTIRAALDTFQQAANRGTAALATPPAPAPQAGEVEA